MNRALLSLAVAGLALSAVQSTFAAGPAFAPQATGDVNALLPVIHFPGGCGFFPLQEAYRVFSASTAGASTAPGACSVARNVGWCGPNQETGRHYPAPADSCADRASSFPMSPELVTAVPGIFALCSVNRNVLTGSGTVDFRQRLNVAPFLACPTGFQSPFVQSVRLRKIIPFQPKCPGVFPGADFSQFGPGIRTWWALLYSPPGTRFILRITVVCQGIPSMFPDQTRVVINEFEWRVVVSPESIMAVVDVLHSNPIGTSEIPCIASEDVFLAICAALNKLICNAGVTSSSTPAQRLLNRQNRLFEAEALVIAFCAFGECFIAEDFFGTVDPPSNDIQMNGAFGPTGILDTLENPCCCKLLVDIDNLGSALGIQTGGV